MSRDNTNRTVEARIAEARERGDFENLPGSGKPLAPDDLAGLSPSERFDALLARSLGEARPEIVLLREIRALRETLEHPHDPESRERLQGILREKAAELGALFDAARVARRRGE